MKMRYSLVARNAAVHMCKLRFINTLQHWSFSAQMPRKMASKTFDPKALLEKHGWKFGKKHVEILPVFITFFRQPYLVVLYCRYVQSVDSCDMSDIW